MYKLPYVLLFSILAIVTACYSYRGIVTFIDVHRQKLNATFGLKWRCAPAYTAIRYILKRLDPADFEVVFRRHAALLQAARAIRCSATIWVKAVLPHPEMLPSVPGIDDALQFIALEDIFWAIRP
jgi:hypothetical protein